MYILYKMNITFHNGLKMDKFLLQDFVKNLKTLYFGFSNAYLNEIKKLLMITFKFHFTSYSGIAVTEQHQIN